MNVTRTPIVVLDDQRPNDSVSFGRFRSVEIQAPPEALPSRAPAAAEAQKRLEALAVLRDEAAHSDVVCEAQELVALALKGTLRAVGIEPPKFRDVGGRADALV